MLADIEPAQFDEWVAYHRLEPWGDDWDQAALIAASIQNQNRSKDLPPIAPGALIPNEDQRKLAELQNKGAGLIGSWKLSAQRAKRK